MSGRATSYGWIRLAVTIAVLAILLARIDRRAALDALLRLHLVPALIVLALVAADRVVMIWRWVILLRAAGVTVPARTAAGIHLVSSFVGSFLPAGVGADAARAYSLAALTSRGSQAVASVAVDRLLGLFGLVAMAALGLAVAGRTVSGDLRLLLIVSAVLAAAAAVMLLWADRWARALLGHRGLASGPGARLLRLADALGLYRQRSRPLMAVALLSAAVQLLRILQAYGLGQGIGIEVAFTYYLLFMPVGLLALMLPISVAGFGLPQGVIVWLMQPLGVPAAEALALSTLIVLAGILGNLPGLWLFLRARAGTVERTGG